MATPISHNVYLTASLHANTTTLQSLAVSPGCHSAALPTLRAKDGQTLIDGEFPRQLSEHRANHSSAPPRPLSWASISITTESPAWNLAVHLSEPCSTRAILPFRSAVKEALPWTYSVAAPIQNHLHPQGTDLLDLPLLPSDSWSRQI
ncbi:hypothetical protein CGCSCA4_v008437 [Colletotrichum siamense]|uniref:Uncharacterized protein n=1 Tax=Colletotrichum siamense TaxID=690259 RepID=A0A9P5ERL0_COLSI|nr:uncharacterized protein CGCS363_v000604 [Colletotrichum siamense]KAF4825670.1 hypothetical protein CGCSCA5_v000122 [Colletotrichum siamense]KAF4842733.1 hypothetical protein CGCSCA4_v008437 [Colletotrichum siamense]KAF4858146.1 hypothetical protein CGCSCA2_v007591 [Colletotrichum siamense]KAF4870554.1 hypothetical protein CGCSCA1_v010295 [Colletotrichum siamense]KAF5515923.1 hypothetical protein CGCS363_v000604 [Colletotrichum siamense]